MSRGFILAICRLYMGRGKTSPELAQIHIYFCARDFRSFSEQFDSREKWIKTAKPMLCSKKLSYF